MPLTTYQAEMKKEKRTALLEAARQLFLEHGFARSSVNTVAKEAGVSTATLYKHFETKEDLFGEVIGEFWQELQSTLELTRLQDQPASEALQMIGDDYAELLSRDTVRALFRIIIGEAKQFPELGKKLFEHGKEAYLAKVEQELNRRTASRELFIDDVSLATQQFLGMINDIVFIPAMLLIDFEISRAEQKRVVREAVETFLKRYEG